MSFFCVKLSDKSEELFGFIRIKILFEPETLSIRKCACIYDDEFRAKILFHVETPFFYVFYGQKSLTNDIIKRGIKDNFGFFKKL